MNYETRNSYVASFLNYAGLVLLSVKRTGQKSLTFVFDDPHNEGAQFEKDFWEDRQITSARRLLDADREVRSEIWKAKQEASV